MVNQMPEFKPLDLKEIIVVTPDRHGDSRGYFSEVYNRDVFARNGIDQTWVQDNQSLSASLHTLRGLHYQTPPFAQDKLIRVLRGRIFDVAVDIRKGSATFGRWVSQELSAEAFNQMLVPVGFAHGFLTLEPDTEVLYKVSAAYSKDHDRAIAWNDSEIAVQWPLNGQSPSLSQKDREAPLLADAELLTPTDKGTAS